MTMTDTPTTEPDVTKLGKIRALLDKAESTSKEFPAEAEALTAKAIELMERYRISEAMIADAAPLQDRGKIIEVDIDAGSGPYASARVMLAHYIGSAHSVKVLMYTKYRGKTIVLVGYQTDVALTEMLYTSLLVQATRSMHSAKALELKPSWEHTTVFRRAFLLSFAKQIGLRLEESGRRARDGAESFSGRSVALVLADRMDDVEEDVFQRYGAIIPSRPIAASASHAGTWAGISAADKADISSDRKVNSNKREELVA